jgi:SPP1 family predicted phage head-tail adaptor
MSRRPMIAGRRLSVTLEAPADVTDPIGGVTRSWAPVATLWAVLEPLPRGVERAEAQRAEGAATHRLIIRWRGDVSPAMRFAAPGKIYDVTTTYDPDGRRRDLVCLVEEVQA